MLCTLLGSSFQKILIYKAGMVSGSWAKFESDFDESSRSVFVRFRRSPVRGVSKRDITPKGLRLPFLDFFGLVASLLFAFVEESSFGSFVACFDLVLFPKLFPLAFLFGSFPTASRFSFICFRLCEESFFSSSFTGSFQSKAQICSSVSDSLEDDFLAPLVVPFSGELVVAMLCGGVLPFNDCRRLAWDSGCSPASNEADESMLFRLLLGFFLVVPLAFDERFLTV
jgi:hypothetical protein